MRPIGFSTGALAKGDFMDALRMLRPHELPCVELSALRMEEVERLTEALPTLNLQGYMSVSFHAPSRFQREDEVRLAELLLEHVPKTWPIVMHPDAVFDYGVWQQFGRQLAIENMDRRKPCGRGVNELAKIFAELPEASLCFDIGHSRQHDSSMTEAYLILTTFSDRLMQVHVSEVNSESHHDPISYGSKLAFQQVAGLIPEETPIIIESRVAEFSIAREIDSARESLTVIGPGRQARNAPFGLGAFIATA
jgi:hypothetical protein